MAAKVFFAVLSLAILVTPVQGEDPKVLPDKLAGLKHNYEAALVRATTPITQTYVQQLQKLKVEYTKAGNLEAALATDAILKEFTQKTQIAGSAATSFPRDLSAMTIVQFKEWLATVSIVEKAGAKTVFQYDGTTFTSIRGPTFAPRAHKVEIELGKISVPFSTDLGVIRVSENLKSAVITYDSEAPIDAKIVPKAKE